MTAAGARYLCIRASIIVPRRESRFGKQKRIATTSGASGKETALESRVDPEGRNSERLTFCSFELYIYVGSCQIDYSFAAPGVLMCVDARG